ncbi:hypothetical protein EV122DRAFT_277627 [Schizophyllum commune]
MSRLNILDYAYRTVTFSCVAVGAWAIYAGWTLMERHAKDKDFKLEVKKKEEAREELLAKQAVSNVDYAANLLRVLDLRRHNTHELFKEGRDERGVDLDTVSRSLPSVASNKFGTIGLTRGIAKAKATS